MTESKSQKISEGDEGDISKSRKRKKRRGREGRRRVELKDEKWKEKRERKRVFEWIRVSRRGRKVGEEGG